MGEEELRGANTAFRWNSADLSGSSRPVDALPCAQTPLCAHGSASAHPDGHSKIAESRGKLAFVPASSFSPMCNPLLRPGQRTHCRRRHPAPTTSTAGSSRLEAGRLDDQPWDATSDHPAHALRRPARPPTPGAGSRSPRARSEAPGGADPVGNGVTPRLHHDTGRTARHAQDTQDNHRLRRNSAQRPPDHRLANASDRSRRETDFLGISQVERGGFPGLAGCIVIAAGRGGPRGLGNPMTGPPSRLGRVLGSPCWPFWRRRKCSPGCGNPGLSPSTTKARGLGETTQDAGRVMSGPHCRCRRGSRIFSPLPPHPPVTLSVAPGSAQDRAGGRRPLIRGTTCCRREV